MDALRVALTTMAYNYFSLFLLALTHSIKLSVTPALTWTLGLHVLLEELVWGGMGSAQQ